MSDDLGRLRNALTGRYEIERELGSGGMATVHLAHDVRHETDGLLDHVMPYVTGETLRQRLEREEQRTAQGQDSPGECSSQTT